VILADAAFESSGASMGAVLIDPSSGTYEFFGKWFHNDLVRKWQKNGNKQVICQAELITVPIALQTWSAHLEQRDVLVFIDNDPARDALVKGCSTSDASAEYAMYCRILCSQLACAPWYARVASPSNLADHPSRGDFALLLKTGARWREPVSIPCEPTLALLDF
jgi:hypothetical protein